ncbi:sugar ABC transporter ATP-binding protein [Hephaestia sp. GCM10023244]|uniref:sugar ABC transporter ATP-binding protein n=1 Tax=unclassified Hephaestia TaxID=2631281 RepID=UPI0020771F30
MNEAAPRLSAQRVSKLYPGVQALDGVDFEVHAGAVNVLIGENGAGKSTLMKIIAGVEQPSAGRLMLDGEEVHFADPAAAARAGVCMVFQELNLFANLSIAENVFIGRERCRLGIDIDRGSEIERTRELLERLDHPLDPRALVSSLTIGQQQIVEIARALAQDARVLILDEPTSALSAAEAETLFAVIAELKARGVAIVYISHRLEELKRIGDYVTVLRDGHLVATAAMADVDVPWIVRQMIGRDAPARADAAPCCTSGGEVLAVTDLVLPRERGGFTVDHVSLTVGAGEIVGIYGLLGAGRTELLESIMGCRRDATGSIRIAGAEISARDVTDRMAAGVALVPEDRRRAGFVQSFSVAHNLTIASLGRFARWCTLDRRREATAVRGSIGDLAIKVAGPETMVTTLSGGNQQKVVIGKALLTRPRVLLLDEPTRGVDVGAKTEQYRLIRHLAEEGLGVLFATSELDELTALATRVLVMCEGKITLDLPCDAADHDSITAAANPRARAA